MTDAMETIFHPLKDVPLPCGRSYQIQPLLLSERTAFDKLYAKALVALSVKGELTDALVRDSLATVLMDGFAQELELTPGRSDALDLLRLFCPALCYGDLQTFSSHDFRELLRTIMEHDPDPFDRQRPGIIRAFGELLFRLEEHQRQMEEAFSSDSSDSSDAPASIPTSPASGIATRGTQRKRKRSTSSDTPPASATPSE